jgi:hypothetical protein
METGKTGKYFKYAIGEIILVMIGILLALQVNNWNEARKEGIEEYAILQNLHDEFSENKKLLKATQKGTTATKQAGIEIMSLFGKPKAVINQHNTDSLLFLVLEFDSFRPSENTINDLIQSGRLKLLKNKKLKVLLYQWQSDLKNLDVSYKRVELKIDDELVPYLSKKYSLKDIDKYGALNWKENTSLEINKFEIFNEIEFENITDDYLYRVITAENNASEIEQRIEAILTETKNK